MRVVDLSGAFRFREARTFERWYGLPAPHANWLGEAVYGLPELYAREIAGTRLVANPGCYATSVILALRPLAEAGWIAEGASVVCDCKSGATGAGKELRRDLQFSELDENFKAYNLFAHRHTPEITEHTGLPESQVVFSTHLLPLARGILSTIYVTSSESRTSEEVEALYRKTLCGTADGADFEARKSAGVAARRAHEFLRHRLRVGCEWAAADCGVVAWTIWERARRGRRCRISIICWESGRKRGCNENCH